MFGTIKIMVNNQFGKLLIIIGVSRAQICVSGGIEIIDGRLIKLGSSKRHHAVCCIIQ